GSRERLCAFDTADAQRSVWRKYPEAIRNLGAVLHCGRSTAAGGAACRRGEGNGVAPFLQVPNEATSTSFQVGRIAYRNERNNRFCLGLLQRGADRAFGGRVCAVPRGNVGRGAVWFLAPI